MVTVAARAMLGPEGPFQTVRVERREVESHDVLIDIAYAGVCHSDIHHARSEWPGTMYPIVPGHEIAGVVTAVGDEVTRFAVGDPVGVGCMVGSCGECVSCRDGLEQYCLSDEGHILTYNAVDHRGQRTYGGYSEKIVVDERFVVPVPKDMHLSLAAPLLCAGITLYSPLRHWGAGPGSRVAIVGMGGLGHVGVQLAHQMGATTTVLNLGSEREDDARRFGASAYVDTTDRAAVEALRHSFDLIISTVPVTVDVNDFLRMLAVDGTLVNLGVPTVPLEVVPHSLLNNRRSLAGSLIGGIDEHREMLEFCSEHGVAPQIELIGAADLDVAYDRLAAGDVRYRFVMDIASLAAIPATPDAITAPR
jgi:uncharacterized zinc-type alcohol dehydrogenase-like protein